MAAGRKLVFSLFLLKYLDFSLSTLERGLVAMGLSFQSPALDLILPAGLSFYLFMSAGYLIDVYRGTQPPEGNFTTLALFLSFFPQVISGPIARAPQLVPQLLQPKPFDGAQFQAGLLRFLWGAFKKLCIADRLATPVNVVFADPSQLGWLQVLAGVLAFSVQIYCDFSAYSDMAIGAAQAMGIHLMENFRTPYFSRSVGEFWRRWHISLSSWFRDYLYIPLGGGRQGQVAKYRNILIVFAVSGLWHGASLTFLVWGLLNGLYQVLGGLTHSLRDACRNRLGFGQDKPWTALWQISVTFGLSTIAWVFFKSGSLTTAVQVFETLFTAPAVVGTLLGNLNWDKWELLAAALGTLVLFVVDLCSLRGEVTPRVVAAPLPLRWLIYLALLLAVVVFGVYGTGYDAQDFIYFQF